MANETNVAEANITRLYAQKQQDARNWPNYIVNAASTACNILAVSNRKFLKLLPGPVSGGRGSNVDLLT